MYIFRLRGDMPRGFIQNERIPELPAAHEFLKKYEGRTFESIDAFLKELLNFDNYLIEHKVPRGTDREVRNGIFVFEDNTIGTYNNAVSKRCEFGTLERKTLD